MKFFQIREFFPKIRMEGDLQGFTGLDGNPAYLLEFDENLSFEENLRRYFRIDSILHQDAFFALQEVFDDPRNYFAIMEAISRGKTVLSEIVNETRLDRGIVGKHISILRRLQEQEGEVVHQRLLLQLLVQVRVSQC